jgi:hypothetical protein
MLAVNGRRRIQKSDQVRPNPTKSDQIRPNPTKSDLRKDCFVWVSRVEAGRGIYDCRPNGVALPIADFGASEA